MSNTTKKVNVQRLCVTAVMLALATALSMVKIIELPYGGSVTLASMLPVVIIAYRYGTAWGIASGLVYGCIQQLLGLNSLSYVTTPLSIIAVILLDYIVAFLVCGFGGIFRKRIKNQAIGISLGAFVVCALRYLCHVISGATVWAGISIPTKAALIYSLSYNGTYMLPETIVLVVTACIFGSLIDFTAERPARLKSEDTNITSNLMSVCAGIVFGAAIVFDVYGIFSKLQNADTGEFAFSQIFKINFTSVILITAAAAVISITLLLVSSKIKKERKNA